MSGLHLFFHQRTVEFARIINRTVAPKPLNLFFFAPVGTLGWASTGQPAWWADSPLPVILVGGGLVLLAIVGWILWMQFSGRHGFSRAPAINDTLGRLFTAVSTTRTFDELLSVCRQWMQEFYHAERAVAMKYSSRENRFYPVTAVGLDPVYSRFFNDAEGPAEFFGPYVTSSEVGFATLKLADREEVWLCLPVVVEGRLVAVLAFSGSDIAESTTELLSETGYLQSVISHFASSSLAAGAGAVHRESVALSRDYQNALTGITTIEEALALTAEVLSPSTSLDYLSLARLDQGSDKLMRWSIAVDREGQLVKSARVTYDSDESGSSFKPPAYPTVVENPGVPSSSGNAGQAIMARMQSRMVFPLNQAGKSPATLTVATGEQGKYDQATLVRLEPAMRVLGEWLEHNETWSEADRLGGYLRVLDRLEDHGTPDQHNVIQLLREAMQVTLVRLLMYHPEDESFSLMASASARPLAAFPPVLSRAPARRLPCHSLALQEGRSCMIDQSDPKRLMSAEEGRLALVENFKTGLLMPLKYGTDGSGVLSVAEMRHPARRRFGEPDQVFLRCAASRIGDLFSDQVRLQSQPRVESDTLMARFATPLTTIFGSVELIRQKVEVIDQTTSRNLYNIERAAERIKDVAAQPGVREPVEAIKPAKTEPHEEILMDWSPV